MTRRCGRLAVAMGASLLLVGVVSVGTAAAVTQTVTSVTPPSLPQGATAVSMVVHGTGFSSATGPVGVSVSGAGVAVSNVTLDSPTQITTTVTVDPAAATGARNVTVTQGPGGLDSATCTGCLTIAARPHLTALAPTGAPNTSASPQNVGATGSNIVAGATVTLKRSGFTDIVVSSPVVSGGGTSVSGTANLLGQAPGRWALVVTNPDGGHDQLGDGITTGYVISGNAPTVTAVAPPTRGQGTTSQVLTLTGTNLARGAQVSFSGTGIAVTGSAWVSLTSFQVTVDVDVAAAPTARDVTFTNTDSQAAVCSSCFTVGAKPTIGTVTPNARGAGASNQLLVVSGTGFVATPAVSFSGTGVTVNNVTRDSATQLTVSVSVATGATVGGRDVTVTNPDGGAATAAGAFTVNAGPTLSSVTPASRGQGAANQDLVVAGTGFVATPTVTVAGTGVTVNHVTRDTATQLTVNVTVAAGAPVGARDVTITNPDAGTVTGAGALSVVAAPAATTFAPNAIGRGASGKTVVVTGTGFQATPVVAVSGTGVTVDDVLRSSATQLTLHVSATSGAATGARDVTITNPDGGTSTAVAALTIDPAPTATSASPSVIGRGATVDVDLTGSGFVATPTVTASGTGVTVNNVTFVSASHLTVNVSVSASAATTARDLVVTNPDGGVATCGACVTPAAGPAVTSITPSAGGSSGSVNITDLAGSGFAPNATARLERTGQTPIPLTGVTVNPAGTKITGSFDLSGGGGAPAAPGAWTVRVTNPDNGGTATLVDGFNVVGGSVSVTSAAPSGGGQSTARAVQITGSGFASGAVVTVSGANVAVSGTTVVSATRIDVTLTVGAAAAPGARDITVTNTDANAGSCASCYTVGAAPTVSAVAPASVAPGGGPKSLTVTGTGFVGTPTVAVSGTGVNVASVVRISATQLTATVVVAPGAPVGARDVTVTNADQGKGTLVGGLTVLAKAVNPHDFSGDGCSDLVAVDGAGGARLYTGGCNSRFTSGAGAALPGYYGATADLLRLDFSGDGCSDNLVVQTNGDLYQLEGACNGTYKSGPVRLVGSGWNSFSTVLSPGDWNGDGCSDLLGVLPNGNLYVYAGNCAGGFKNGVGILIGTSWNSFATIIAPGDWNGDGCNDVLGVLPNGNLYLYGGSCAGGFKNGVGILIGSSWNSFATIIGPGDWSGDSCPDVLGVLPNGDLYLYDGTCTGGFKNGVGILIGTSWDSFRLVR